MCIRDSLSEARAIPGVVKVLTCFDVPDIQFPTPGHPWSVEKAHQDISDRKLLASRVRYYGEDVYKRQSRSSWGSAASTRTSRSGWARITAPPPASPVRAKSSG